jgi:hypothetical protein
MKKRILFTFMLGAMGLLVPSFNSYQAFGQDPCNSCTYKNKDKACIRISLEIENGQTSLTIENGNRILATRPIARLEIKLCP